jgi:hypothetical protein
MGYGSASGGYRGRGPRHGRFEEARGGRVRSTSHIKKLCGKSRRIDIVHVGGLFMLDNVQQRSIGMNIASIFILIFALTSCTPKINYTFDPNQSFQNLKTYDWKPYSNQYKMTNNLIEENIKSSVDGLLRARGFEKTSENPNMLIVLFYENSGFEQFKKYQYTLTTLNFDILDSQTQALIWRGTAFGRLDAGSASKALPKAIEKIFANFPPPAK